MLSNEWPHLILCFLDVKHIKKNGNDLIYFAISTLHI